MRHTWVYQMGAAMLVSWVATGCWVDTFDDYDNFNEVVTVHDPDYPFAGNKTYAMPERIFDLSSLVEDGTGLQYDYDELVLSEIAEQMADLGYDRVADPRSGEADVIIAVGAVVEEDWAYGYYYWYDYYYYYPPVSVSVSYEVGTLIIAMLDPKLADEEHKTIPVTWVAGLTGLMHNHSSSEIRAAISQAYEQSSYLKVGPPVPAEPGLPRPDAGVLDTSDTDAPDTSVPEEPDAGLNADGGGAL